MNNIYKVASYWVVLSKKGNFAYGLCPFHKETTPSFQINITNDFENEGNAKPNSFKCFGCGVEGDPIDFIMKIENINREKAIKHFEVNYVD